MQTRLSYVILFFNTTAVPILGPLTYARKLYVLMLRLKKRCVSLVYAVYTFMTLLFRKLILSIPIYQLPLILTAPDKHFLSHDMYLYQVMMRLHILNDVANDTESTQKSKITSQSLV